MEIDERKAAQIILSIGTHRKRRVLDPITVAEELQKLTKRFPRKEVARRFKIADRTLRTYFKLLNLPEHVKELIRSRKIGQDLAYRLTLLDNPEDQEVLANAILESDLTNKEVRAIVQTLKRRNPNMPISQCMELVIKYRPRIEEEFLIITKVEMDTLRDLSAISEDKNIRLDDLFKQIVLEVVPADSLSSIRIEGEVVMLSLDRQGNRAYKNAARKMRVRDFELLNVLARNWMEMHED